MKLFVFASGGRQAITDDRTGDKLPDSQNWQYSRTVDTARWTSEGQPIGASQEEIFTSIEEKGYLIWPQRGDDDA